MNQEKTSPDRKALNLWVQENGAWDLLPDWAYFFIQLGAAFSEAEVGCRLVIGLVVPTRAYAAAFSALGVVVSRAAEPIVASTAHEHFKRLLTLEPGTRVTLLDHRRKLDGTLLGSREFRGETQVGVKVLDRGNFTHYWEPASESLRINVCADQWTPAPEKQSRRRIVSRDLFLKQFLHGQSPWEFASASRLECALLGPITVLRRELRETFFGLRVGGKIEAGTLQDVLRVRRFLSTSQEYRSDVLHSLGKKVPRPAGGCVPFVTIFDGSAGFIKWRDQFSDGHWLVILSHTDNRVDDAAAILNSEHSRRTAEGLADMPLLPAGVELISYGANHK